MVIQQLLLERRERGREREKERERERETHTHTERAKGGESALSSKGKRPITEYMAVGGQPVADGLARE